MGEEIRLDSEIQKRFAIKFLGSISPILTPNSGKTIFLYRFEKKYYDLDGNINKLNEFDKNYIIENYIAK